MRLFLLVSLAVSPIRSQSTDWQAGVVQVSAKDISPGSGFVVAVRSGRAYIVTCAHVVEGDPKPLVTFRSAPEEQYSAVVRHQQAGRMEGLALLVVEKPPTNVRALEAVTTAVGAGTAVTVAGYPVSLGAFTVLPATVVSVQGTELYLAPVTGEGFSGGPVVVDGRVAGVVFGRGEFGRAVPAAIMDAYLHGLDVRWGDDAPVAGTVRVNAKDGLKYVWIPPGKFMMGCSPGDKECMPDERQRAVTIPQGFWLGQTEVTQAAYARVMGANPSRFKDAQRPVETVNWEEASEYCHKAGGRLPSDAEWEYAARAGNPNSTYGELGSIAWYETNSGGQTHRVAEKLPNAWGLYDMLGNVSEWTADLWAPNVTARSTRGGSWFMDPGSIRVSERVDAEPVARFAFLGFRCAEDSR